MKSGTSVPGTACNSTVWRPMTSTYPGRVRPRTEARSATASDPSSPPETPTRTGVPTAPKLTGVLWMTSPTITAAMAGKPRASISGATTAAGVPKPEAPSMKLPKSQPMMIAWIRRSGVMSVKVARIVAMAPLPLRVASRSRAPKMM